MLQSIGPVAEHMDEWVRSEVGCGICMSGDLSVCNVYAWIFLLIGGVESIVFGPIRWCVWLFWLSSPLRLLHLK